MGYLNLPAYAVAADAAAYAVAAAKIKRKIIQYGVELVGGAGMMKRCFYFYDYEITLLEEN